MVLLNKRIGVIITGGIAAYKATELVRQLIKAGAIVRVLMTKSACEFITPLTLQVLSRHQVILDTFSEKDAEHVQHIEFADWCELVVIAPATANIIGKLANGIADEIASTTLMAITSPCLVCPAMNSHMYQHSATQRNLSQLKADGYYILEPESGFLAEGYQGKGRLPEISRIVEKLESIMANSFYPQLLKGKKVIVTAGGTRERIDPVRYITNDSSGKMGYAMAKFASFLGGEVTLITTNNHFAVLENMNLVPVESAVEMQSEINKRYNQTDYVIMAAAVSDFRLKHQASQKIKKQDHQTQNLIWELTENPDILAELGKNKDHQVLVGFAAETQNLIEFAKKKLESKGSDWIIANDVSQSDIGFNSSQNQVTILNSEGHIVTLPKMDKFDLAKEIWGIILNYENAKD
ncbi:bifunctional phosphopantothenoylcysteine decarboxylase/phosphopantothenate--cysteine ligase CoaBC [Facklamia miroungae]|uniref:Coenzyme A biosynthesis bifunctional protein CoaBC n=1 Tax=Facklamia miroungae TaxID=120956 RepID=A0A1G7SFJ3_9LACT|nr:bifunctional phosphopantothenoylcysteine decarboxylase/phosphopantothenate--cysteine ligase CoaBC [Facklamia miroungae]NKZ29670.1 bifunctional phosphopantothenoylcysteine decarboxylase/phosphopantothenate--cysteine ligase CoaBC [Facklamia miroungae]SDG21768.1 phosphopantothenoylcysteine decarboxylase / phosphopantothenate--cysteine ligase [Facklamia miroungae]